MTCATRFISSYPKSWSSSECTSRCAPSQAMARVVSRARAWKCHAKPGNSHDQPTHRQHRAFQFEPALRCAFATLQSPCLIESGRSNWLARLRGGSLRQFAVDGLCRLSNSRRYVKAISDVERCFRSSFTVRLLRSVEDLTLTEKNLHSGYSIENLEPAPPRLPADHRFGVAF